MFARSEAARRSYLCTSFPGTSAAGMRKLTFFPVIIAAQRIARGDIPRPTCQPTCKPMTRCVRPKISLTWCARSLIGPRISWGSRWAALPRCILRSDIPDSRAHSSWPASGTAPSRSSSRNTPPQCARKPTTPRQSVWPPSLASLPAAVTRTLMVSLEDREALARAVLEVADRGL